MVKLKGSQRLFRDMKVAGMLIAAAFMGVLPVGCQSARIGGKGQIIEPSAVIQLVSAGEQAGRFSDGYVTVNYRYTMTGGDLLMAGTITFGDELGMNFDTVNAFDLGLLLGDAQGRVLLQQSLTTTSENSLSSTIHFNAVVFLPRQAACMAFTYNGLVYGAGGESPTSIWLDPVLR